MGGDGERGGRKREDERRGHTSRRVNRGNDADRGGGVSAWTAARELIMAGG